jgi:hypothetical protein
MKLPAARHDVLRLALSLVAALTVTQPFAQDRVHVVQQGNMLLIHLGFPDQI